MNKLKMIGRSFFSKSNVLRYFYLSLIFIFCLLPLFFLLFNISGKDLSFVFKDNSFYKAIVNSLLYTALSASISTLLALLAAYYLSRMNISKVIKKTIILLLTIPMLIPTLSIGLGFRVLFGINGLLDVIFNIEIEAIGFFGMILGSIIISFPPTFLILFDSLRYEDKTPYDAAEIVGINKFSTFLRITLPYIEKPLITAFFACFTLIFSDYGIPMELAGKIKTLPMYLYEQIDSVYSYGRGALVGLFLLIPAISSFVIDLFLKEDNGGDFSASKIKPSKLFNAIGITVCLLILIFIAIPEISFISLSFMKGYPNNISFSVNNFANIDKYTHGIGLPNFISNSIVMSILTGCVGVFFSYTTAYLSTRLSGKVGKILHFLAISSIAIPGIVLGVGYIFLFKSTNGFFYGTMAILVAVNTIHFFGSPYLMARNSFSKMNKDYEIVGKTIGVSRFRIFLTVLLPNSLPTLIEMFSFFFLNSMITISAVAFLCTYSNQPLSMLIKTFEKTSNYEMQSVVSFIILGINLLSKGAFSVLGFILHKKVEGKEEKIIMELTRFQFDLMTYLEKNGKNHYTQRVLADNLTLSLGTINKLLKELTELNYISVTSDSELYITEKGLKALEPYKVKRAIIIAAGFGSRLAPVTLDIPKPLVKVNGVRIIDTLIDALYNKGIENITIVRGYKKEQFDQLLEKYPFLQFVDNDEFNVTNNISSIFRVIDKIDCCYICEADLLISNPDIINKYEFTSCYMGAKVAETDDWCFKKSNGYIDKYKMGGEDCYQAFGISYWNEKDSIKLRNDVIKVYNSRAGKENFWDAVPLRICKKNYRIEIKPCSKADITEIDNFSELIALDSSYDKYPGYDKF